MKGIFEHLTGWLNRKEAEKFTTDAAGNTAVNITGDIALEGITVEDWEVELVSAPIKGDEYTFSIDAGVKRFEVKAQGIALIKISRNTGETSTKFRQILPENSWKEENIVSSGPLTFYFETNKVGETIEITKWT